MYRGLALAVVALVTLGASRTAAEETGPRLFLGYSYQRGRDAGPQDSDPALHGVDVSLAVPFRGRLGLEGDLSHHWGSEDGVDLRWLAFSAGPRLQWGGAVAPFAHLLVGGVRWSESLSVFGATISRSETHPALSPGGGLEWKARARWAVRLQADYVIVWTDEDTEGDPRITIGLCYRP